MNKSFFEKEINESVEYLKSSSALKTMEVDPYWPKWNSPWWHMLLLHEMDLNESIPKDILNAYVRSLNKMPLKIFPINPEEMPKDIDPYRGMPCHCQLGNVYQVLSKCRIDVDQELPWIRPWFLKYQMSDGGLSCDNDAYLVKDETPSSMVGTIAAFESILLYTKRNWTEDEKIFLNRGAQFLMTRKLMLGSNTKHNASERKSAENWTKLCFPRFYFYDVLRGLYALLIWSKKTNQAIPAESICDVVAFLKNHFPNDEVIIGRESYAGVGTILQTESGEWIRKQPATFFPLLKKVSQTGENSPFLTEQWKLCLKIMEDLLS